MSGRLRTRLWLAGVLGAVVAGGLVIQVWRSGGQGSAKPTSAVTFDAQTPLSILIPALRDSDARALTALAQRMTTKTDKPAVAIRDETEATEWLNTLAALRSGYLRFGAYGRATALTVSTRILDHFAVDQAPASWPRALPLMHDLLSAGMTDPDVNVRVTGLTVMGRLWSWLPGRDAEPMQEAGLLQWKEGLYRPVKRCLTDAVAKVRVAAIACLATAPNEASAPAVPYLEDMSSGEVRRQVLISFATRRSVMGEDVVIKKLYDPDPSVIETAEVVLKLRGLRAEHIDLARMIYHPKPELRASVIALIRNRTDIDPIVWLLELSRDPDPSVRGRAVEALASKLSPEVRRRLAEMAKSDQSPEVRQAAGKIVPPDSEKTVALPPLPGSPSLNPKAN